MKQRLSFAVVGNFTEYRFTRYQYAPTELQESLVIPVKRDGFIVTFTRSRNEAGNTDDIEFTRCHAGLLYRLTIELWDLPRGKRYVQHYYYESNRLQYSECWSRFLIEFERARKDNGKPISLTLDRVVSRFIP